MGATVNYGSNANVKIGQLILFMGDLPVAYAKSAKMTLSASITDTTNKMDGSWGSGIAGKRSATFESEGLLTEQASTQNYHALVKALIAGAPLSFQFGTMKATQNADGTLSDVAVDTTFPNYKGSLILTSLEITSEAGNVATNTVQAQSSGPITPVDAVAAGA